MKILYGKQHLVYNTLYTLAFKADVCECEQEGFFFFFFLPASLAGGVYTDVCGVFSGS